MHGGVQARGEWIDGQSFTGTRTFGGYVDVLVHRQGMGPVTAVGRVERLDYLAGRRSVFEKRYTAGARVRLASMLVGHVNVVREVRARRDARILAGSRSHVHGSTIAIWARR